LYKIICLGKTKVDPLVVPPTSEMLIWLSMNYLGTQSPDYIRPDGILVGTGKQLADMGEPWKAESGSLVMVPMLPMRPIFPLFARAEKIRLQLTPLTIGCCH
jgi:hypothetical protein